MGQIANQMVLELFFKLKQRIKEKKDIKKNQDEGKTQVKGNG